MKWISKKLFVRLVWMLLCAVGLSVLSSCTTGGWRGDKVVVGPPEDFSSSSSGGVVAGRSAETFNKSDRVVGGYYTYCKAQPIESIPFENYNYIVHAFLRAGPDGKLHPERGRKMPSSELTAAAHKHGVKVLISLGGGRYTQFDKFTKKPKQRKAYVDAVINVVDKYGYDGIDLDWEYPKDAGSSRRWSELIATFRKELDELSRRTGKSYLLTAAVGPVRWFARWIPKDVVDENIDFLHVMTYNYCGIWGGWAGEHAPLSSPRKHDSIAESLRYWHEDKGIAKSKLAVGLPFYAYLFTGYKPGQKVDPKAKNGSKVKAISYADIKAKFAPVWKHKLDPLTRVSWYTSPDGKSFIVSDGPAAIRYKTLWVLKEGYRGVFCWAMRHNSLPGGTTPLADAMRAASSYHKKRYVKKNVASSK